MGGGGGKDGSTNSSKRRGVAPTSNPNSSNKTSKSAGKERGKSKGPNGAKAGFTQQESDNKDVSCHLTSSQNEHSEL